MPQRDVLLLSHDAFLDHRPGAGHPESPERLRAVLALLRERPVPGARWAEPQTVLPVDDRLLGAIHDEAHLARLRQLTGRSDWLDPDTRTSPGSTRAAWLAA